MPVTPSGPYSTPLDALKTLLADCPTFRTWVGAANATEAKARIHLVAPADPEPTRPFAVISQEGDWSARINAVGGAPSTNGKLLLAFEGSIPEAYQAEDKAADAELDFSNHIGAILLDIATLIATDLQYLRVRGIASDGMPPQRNDLKDAKQHGHYYYQLFIVEWS